MDGSKLHYALLIAAVTAPVLVSCSKNDSALNSHADGIVGFSSVLDAGVEILKRKNGALRVCYYGTHNGGGTRPFDADTSPLTLIACHPIPETP